MPRPLLNKTTDELVQLFNERRKSAEGLRELAEELSHRQRPRAIALREEVEAALRELTDKRVHHAPQPEASRNDSCAGSRPSATRTESHRNEGRQANRDTAGDYSAPPNEFTLIQPLGVKGRPSAFKPTLLNNVK